MSTAHVARVLALVALVTLAFPLLGQQSYVSRYDVFTGYTYLNSPKVSMAEHGFHLQAGFRPKPWYSLGFDYSVSNGDLTLTPSLLPDELQHTLATQLGQLAAVGRLPAGYQLVVGGHSNTQTFTLGPQLAYRHFEKFTLFLRPGLGAIREVATPTPKDPIATMVVAGLAPTGKKTDWTYFYGLGGGMEYNVTKHFALRFQADFAHDHFFNDVLKAGNTIRFSVGPAFQWGENVAE